MFGRRKGAWQQRLATPTENVQLPSHRLAWETIQGHRGSCGAYCSFCQALNNDALRKASVLAIADLTMQQQKAIMAEQFKARAKAIASVLAFKENWHKVVTEAYALLSVHLLATVSITLILYFTPGVLNWISNSRNNWLCLITASLHYTGTIATSFSQFLRLMARLTPVVFLPMIVGEGYISARVVGMFKPITALTSLLITVGLFLAITLHSFRAKVDLTTKIVYLSVATVTLMLFAIMGTTMGIFKENPTVYLGFSIVYVVVAAAWMVVDTQLLQGDRLYRISIRDTAYVSLQLSTEIVTIFWHLLFIVAHYNGEVVE